MRAVYITIHDMTQSAASGGEQCSKRNYTLLRQIFGAENVFCCCFTLGQPKTSDHMLQLKRTKGDWDALLAALQLHKYYFRNQDKKILQWINTLNADVLFFEGSIYGNIIAKAQAKHRKILYLQNIEKEYAKNKVKHAGPQYLPSFWASVYNERLSVRKADKIICLTARDAGLLKQCYGRETDLILPISFPDYCDESKLQQGNTKKELLFIGSLFAPNLDGISWFCKEIMPCLPEYTLTIVGRNFEQKREQLAAKNISVVGSVDDLSAYYYRYPVIVMPIRFGDGMKVKTAEAMMYGKTIFASDEALEGYTTDKVRGIYRCNTKQEYVQAIEAFFIQKEIPMMQQDVRDLFLEEYETTALEEKLKALLED